MPATPANILSPKFFPSLISLLLTRVKSRLDPRPKADKKDLEQAKRGQVNEPRNLAIYLARKHSGLRLSEIGLEFGLEKYSSVSSVVIRTEKLLSQNKKLRKRLEKIRSLMRKSQAKT
jgi:hypothetical protein